MKLSERSRHINDIILIVFLVIITCVISLIVYNRDDEEKMMVEVCVDGETISAYPLGKSSEYNIEQLLETGNFLVIEDGQVYFKDADCPDRLCVKQGKISHVGQSIVCLPNKVVIRITGDEGNTEGLDVMPR